jgi:putative aldouronate transport system substrate-binding protein
MFARRMSKVIIWLVVIAFLSSMFIFYNVASAQSSKPVLTIFTWMDPKAAPVLKNYREMAVYQTIMKKFKVDLQFIHPAMGSENEQFNIMVASRQLPDIIDWHWFAYPGGPQKAIMDNVIIKLNPYMQYAPNLKKYFDTHPDIKKMATTDDGTIYMFPFIREDKINCTFYGPMIRKDWLEKLNLTVPETVDEWYKMLLAIKKNASKLNSKMPVYPFSADYWSANPRGVFDYCSFLVGAWGIKTDFYVDKNRVKFGPLQPEFKQFMSVLQKWWKDGLIDPDLLTMNRQAIQAKIMNDQIGAWLGLLGGTMGKFLQAKKGTEFDLVGAPYPTLKKGQVAELGQRDFPINGDGMAITPKCKNVQLAVKILDWGYSKEGYLAYNFGVEGRSYVMKNGIPTYTEAILNHPKLSAMEAIAQYGRVSWSGPFVQSKYYVNQMVAMLPQQKDALKEWTKPDNSKLLPPITFTPDEAAKISNIMNTVNTYYNEMFVKLLTGKSNDMNGFVNTLKRMRIDEALKIYQTAYERFMKKK